MYMTEQRKKLFEFFKSHPDMTISARDLAAQLVAVDLLQRRAGNHGGLAGTEA